MKEFKITEEQIKELVNNCHSSQCKEDYLRELFPEVFETVLEVGNWYRVSNIKDGSKGFSGLGMYTEEKHDAGLLGNDKGFNFKQVDDMIWRTDGKIKEATEQEVFEDLKNEAVKRGFVSGCFHTITNGCGIKELPCKYPARYGFYAPENKFLLNNWSIFENGKWAEIIPSITKQESEKQLGKKIID